MELIINRLNKHLSLHPHVAPSAPRSLTLARVIADGYELSWIPPQEPHGEVQYRIKLTNTHNGTEVEVNTTRDHYNMTGLMPGVTYHVTVAAMNSVGMGAESEAILLTTIPLETSATPTEPQDTGEPGTCPVTSSRLPFSQYVMNNMNSLFPGKLPSPTSPNMGTYTKEIA